MTGNGAPREFKQADPCSLVVFGASGDLRVWQPGVEGHHRPDQSRARGAASIAGLLITTEAMVAELPKKQGPAMPGGPGGGMGGMGGMDF